MCADFPGVGAVCAVLDICFRTVAIGKTAGLSTSLDTNAQRDSDMSRQRSVLRRASSGLYYSLLYSVLASKVEAQRSPDMTHESRDAQGFRRFSERVRLHLKR